ncbi:hypothetical protein J2S13_000818 [Oikeobacillus pervagus]|uniref:Uncharacterized protein n=1 Tax=Oikeobacillus pervagus TaxID=1325931 RepID=A0AAJ1SZB3_9BACI|nr:hypothetical protein [Oikeobacillus pervagus]
MEKDQEGICTMNGEKGGPLKLGEKPKRILS